MENPTNEYPEPRTEYIEARKVSMVTLDAKEVPLVKPSKPVELEEDEEPELVSEKDYIPTSNLLQVRSVAFATMEEELFPPKEETEEEKKENKEHTLFYGAVMGGKANVDRTMEEKKIDKQC